VEENHALYLLNTIHQAMVVDDLDFSIDHARLKDFAIKQADFCKAAELHTAICHFEKYLLGKLAYTELEIKTGYKMPNSGCAVFAAKPPR
jgi:hypothetical protein